PQNCLQATAIQHENIPTASSFAPPCGRQGSSTMNLPPNDTAVNSEQTPNCTLRYARQFGFAATLYCPACSTIESSLKDEDALGFPYACTADYRDDSQRPHWHTQ